MSERPDLRRIAGDIREALAGADRDTLADVLTYVFEEYVIESPPAMRAPPAETLDELADLGFPELIEALKMRLDHPELDLFRVEGEQVLVRVGGALAPLDATSPQAPTVPEPEVAPAGAGDEAPNAGGDEPAGADPSPPPVARPGSRPGAGLVTEPISVSSSLTRAPASSAPPARDVSSAPPAPPRAVAPAEAPGGASKGPDSKRDDKDGGDGAGDDDASIRFSLLELD